jgi:hypothetical protein
MAADKSAKMTRKVQPRREFSALSRRRPPLRKVKKIEPGF